MIKECKVLSYNPFINSIVVDFDGLHIQMTGKIDKNVQTIHVRYENGVAVICEKADYKKSLKPKAVKKPKKVEAIKKIVKSEAVENETDKITE